MKYILILLFFSVNIFSFNLIQRNQNKDGSFGSQKKEILTSVMLLNLLSHGETTTSKHFGGSVKSAMIYLNGRVDDLCNKKYLNFEDVYVLWALSEAYAMIGTSILEERVERLCSHVLKYCNEKQWVKLDKDEYSHFNNILSNALSSAKICGLEAIEEVDLRAIMTGVIKNFKVLSTNQPYDIATMKLIQLRWQVDLKDILCLKETYTKAEHQRVSAIKTRLNDASKIRKKAFIEASNLPSELLALLINDLEKSKVVELSETAKDLRKVTIVSLDLHDWESFFEDSKNSPFKMLPITLYYFYKGGQEWQLWNKKSKKYLSAIQSKEGLWSEDLEVPSSLKLKGKDKVFFSSAFAALNLTVHYRYLPGFKFPRKINLPVVEEETDEDEEGLDLIEE